MSQLSKIPVEVGSLKVVQNATVKLGNVTSAPVKVTPAHTSLADSAATLTVSQVQSGILAITPTASRILTTPTAAQLVAGPLKNVGDSIDFSVVNKSAGAFTATLAAGSGVTANGNLIVLDTTSGGSGSGLFRLRVTNAIPSLEAITIHRLA